MNTPEQVARRWFHEIWDNRNPDVIHELMHRDAVGYLEGPVEKIVGPDDFAEFQTRILADMPDLQVTVVNVLADGHEACVLWHAEAHRGAAKFRGTTWFRVENGKVIEGWDCWNQGALAMTLASLNARNDSLA